MFESAVLKGIQEYGCKLNVKHFKKCENNGQILIILSYIINNIYKLYIKFKIKIQL